MKGKYQITLNNVVCYYQKANLTIFLYIRKKANTTVKRMRVHRTCNGDVCCHIETYALLLRYLSTLKRKHTTDIVGSNCMQMVC